MELRFVIKYINPLNHGGYEITADSEKYTKIAQSLLPDFSHMTTESKPQLKSKRYKKFDELKSDEKALQRYDSTIPRDKQNQERYQLHRSQHPDMSNYVKETVIKEEQFVFQPDNYPYDVPPDTAHYNLWVADPALTDDEVAQYLGRILKEFNLEANDVVIIEKPPVEKRPPILMPSVPDIRHLHVFFRKDKDQDYFSVIDDSVNYFNQTYPENTTGEAMSI